MSCSACSLCEGAKTVGIGGTGCARDVDVLFVGESPDSREDIGGKPWVGASSRFVLASMRRLEDAIKKSTGRSPRIRSTYAVRCFSFSQDKWGSVGPCRHHLVAEIQRTKPKRIITFGSIAASSVIKERLRIQSVIEGWHVMDFGYGRVPVQFLAHPKQAVSNSAFRAIWRQQFCDVVLHKPPKHLKGADAVEVHVVDSEEEAVCAIESMMPAKACAYDVEYNPTSGRFLCYALAVDENEAYAFPEHIAHISSVKNALIRLFNNGPVMHAHNWKFDADVSVRALGLPVGLFTDPDRAWVDTSVLRKIDNPEQESKLEVSEWMVGLGGHKKELYDLLGTINTSVKTIGDRYERAYDTDSELVLRYCGGDVISCLRLGNLYARRLERSGLAYAVRDVMTPIGPVLFATEQHGIKVDKAAMDVLSSRLVSDIALELATIRADPVVSRLEKRTKSKSMLQSGFNPGSSEHMAELLFGPNGLGFTATSHTKTGKPSVTANVRKQFIPRAPILQNCAEYVRLGKLHSTYVDGWRKRLGDDGCLHTTFRQDAARTGRLASRNPNLQNIPRAVSAETKLLRSLIVPHHDGEYLMEIDFSQMELRQLAMESCDEELLRCFVERVDVHRRTAAAMTGKSIDDVTKEERQSGKPINFGVVTPN